MTTRRTFRELTAPGDGARFLFFGGKGGVGKTTTAAAAAVWLADHGHRTTIVSTDPTVSLAAVFDQDLGGSTVVPVRDVPNLSAVVINPRESQGEFQARFTTVMGTVAKDLGPEMLGTPCMEEMSAFDQFVSFLEAPAQSIVVFDTAPTGKTLRELAMPFDWASFLALQIKEGKRLAGLWQEPGQLLAGLERDKLRYERALTALQDPLTTVFTLVLLPERLPVEETQSAMAGLARLGIRVQALAVNQCIPDGAIQENAFLLERSRLQQRYLGEIERRLGRLATVRIPLLDRDVSDVASVRTIGHLLFDVPQSLADPGAASGARQAAGGAGR